MNKWKEHALSGALQPPKPKRPASSTVTSNQQCSEQKGVSFKSSSTIVRQGQSPSTSEGQSTMSRPTQPGESSSTCIDSPTKSNIDFDALFASMKRAGGGNITINSDNSIRIDIPK